MNEQQIVSAQAFAMWFRRLQEQIARAEPVQTTEAEQLAMILSGGMWPRI